MFLNPLRRNAYPGASFLSTQEKLSTHPLKHMPLKCLRVLKLTVWPRYGAEIPRPAGIGINPQWPERSEGQRP